MSDNFAPTPLHGAAYRVLLDRCDVANCSNQEARAKIGVTLSDVTQWAKTQEKPVADAYAWAITRVTTDADARLAVCNNSTRVFAAYDTIPRPPNKDADNGPDWPPRASARGHTNGTRRHGTTGQLWEAQDGQWVRVPV